MEYLVNLSVLFTEITFEEVLFSTIIIICIAQAIILGIILGDRYKIKRKYLDLMQDFQVLQMSSQQSDFHKTNNLGTNNLVTNNLVVNTNRTISIQQPVESEVDKEHTLSIAIYKNLQKLMEEEKIYHDPRLTRDEVASRLGTSRKTFLDTLQRHINMSFIEYTNKYRLDEAVELLENGEYTNETIAEEVGFGSVNTFYRQFRQRYGISPLEYRKALNDNLVPSGF